MLLDYPRLDKYVGVVHDYGGRSLVTEKTKRWGHGRVIFIADLENIRAEIARAIPLTEVFAARSERLGIGYSAFCKLVAKYAPDAKIKPSDAPAPSTQRTEEKTSVRKRTPFAEHTGIADTAALRKLTRG